MTEKPRIPRPLPPRDTPVRTMRPVSSSGESSEPAAPTSADTSTSTPASPVPPPASASLNNHQMDKKIRVSYWNTRRLLFAGIGIAVVVFVVYAAFMIDGRSRLNVNADRLTISTVVTGDFQEYIPETGTVMPIITTAIDAIEGGVIQQVNVESGQFVKKGEIILTLANSAMQLDVLSREAQLYEQINNIQNTRMTIERNNLNLQTQLAEIKYQIGLLQPQFDRQRDLYAKKLISQQDYDNVAQNYDYQRKRFELNQASYRRDSAYQVIQIQQLKESEDRLWRNLRGVMQILENLTVRAGASGQISFESDWEPGQSISPRQRIGQIDDISGYKVRVGIDEHYLPRITTGLEGDFEFAGQKYRLRIDKVFPTITNGVFDVDMIFVKNKPNGIRRGQTVRLTLELGTPGKAVQLARGGFYQKTGGNWVYLISEDGNSASKHSVRLGRQNTDFFEVLEGLKPGDRVLTSSYDTFGDAEILVLNR